MQTRIVLASTSPYRRALLEGLGLEYTAHAPEFDEDHGLSLAPEEMVRRFAVGKAESLARSFPDAVIIGSDQLAEIDGQLLTKPGTEARAVDQLIALAGRTHRLLTAVAVHDARSAQTHCELSVYEMRMRSLTKEQVLEYVRRDQPLNCAGAYKVESLGVLLFEEMRGTDHTAIVGLPITLTSALLRRVGVDLLDSALGLSRR